MRQDEDLLIGIINNRADLQILDERHWYRIPTTSIKSREPGWPPRWFAAFEVTSLGEGQQQVLRFGEIAHIEVVGRAELFPDEPPGDKSHKDYYRLKLKAIEHLPAPLVPRRPRRNPFIRSTHRRLMEAKEFNQLFFDGAFEDVLWDALEENVIPAERQWETSVEGRKYILDFAIFCEGDDLASRSMVLGTTISPSRASTTRTATTDSQRRAGTCSGSRHAKFGGKSRSASGRLARRSDGTEGSPVILCAGTTPFGAVSSQRS